MPNNVDGFERMLRLLEDEDLHRRVFENILWRVSFLAFVAIIASSC